MKTIIFIAYKQLVKRKRETVTAMLSIVIATVVMLVSLAISSGLDQSMIKSMLSMMPHVKVTNSVMSLDNYSEEAMLISKIPGVSSATPTYESQGILQYQSSQGNFVTGVMLEGVPSSGSGTAFNLSHLVVSGSATFPNLGSVIIGKQLASTLGATLGSSVKITSSADQVLYLTVSGIFYSGYYDYDTRVVILPLTTMQIISQSGSVATSINVQLNNPYKAPLLAKKIQQETGLETQTWGEQNANLLYALSLERTVMILIMSLILIVSGFVVAVVLSTLVKEKTRDIGIMRAYGMSRYSILMIFMLVGMALAVVGLVVGLLLAMMIIFILKHYSLSFLTQAYYLVKLPVRLTWTDVVMTFAETVIIVLVFTAIPAWKASKLQIVEALKHE